MATFQTIGFCSAPLLQVGFALGCYFNETDHASAADVFESLLDHLRSLQSAAWRWDFARISDQAVRGDNYPVTFGTTKPGTLGPTPIQEAGPGNCLLIRKIDVVEFKRGYWFLHGVPLNEFNGRAWVPDLAAEAAVTALKTFVAANSPLWATRTNPGVLPPVYSYTPFADVQAEKLVTHKIGRPFDDIHGRRRIG